MDTILVLFVIIIALLLYLIPIFISNSRNVRNMEGIALVTIFLGWTVLGWLIAVVWASSAETKEEFEFKYGDESDSSSTSSISKQKNKNIDKASITNIELTDDQCSALKIKESTIDDFDSIRILRNNSQPEFITAKMWRNLASKLKADEYIILGYYKKKKKKKKSSQVKSIELPNDYEYVTIKNPLGITETISRIEWKELVAKYGKHSCVVLGYS